VRRIKELVFGEGLTLAGARRRLEESQPRQAAESRSEMAEVLDTLGADARARIDIVRNGLRSILDVLSKRAGAVPVTELPRNGSRPPAKNVTRVAAQPQPKRHSTRRKSSSKRKSAHT
jgi:hypothetical protein